VETKGIVQRKEKRKTSGLGPYNKDIHTEQSKSVKENKEGQKQTFFSLRTCNILVRIRTTPKTKNKGGGQKRYTYGQHPDSGEKKNKKT